MDIQEGRKCRREQALHPHRTLLVLVHRGRYGCYGHEDEEQGGDEEDARRGDYAREDGEGKNERERALIAYDEPPTNSVDISRCPAISSSHLAPGKGMPSSIRQEPQKENRIVTRNGRCIEINWILGSVFHHHTAGEYLLDMSPIVGFPTIS